MYPPPPQTLRAGDAAVGRVYDALARALPDGAVRRDPDALAACAADESGAGAYPPQLVVRPRTTAEVAEAVRVAMHHGVPVVPRGAGSGRAGGCLAVQGGMVLSLEAMDRLRSVDTASLTATAEPGVITGRLHEAAEAEGLFYAPDPNSLEYCHLGGNVATNASGPRNPKYGPTRDHVLGLEVVLPGGDVVRTGVRTLKGVAGYDLTALMVGSEGTLGIVTEITVRLLPRPRHVETALLFFPGVAAASRAVVAIMQAGFRPRTLEMMDDVAIDAVRPKAPFRFPEGEQSALILELDGADRDAVFAELAAVGELAESRLGASMVLVAKSASERADLWASRRIMSPALREHWGMKYAEDVAVPLDRVPEMVERAHARAAEAGIGSAVYGHAGDGNLHVNFLFRSEDAWPNVMRAAEAVFRDAVALGGTITGEHGVGLLKRGFLPIEQAPAAIALQRRIKGLLDPDDLMNPGKVFPGPNEGTR
jgi:glycolate oxidase